MKLSIRDNTLYVDNIKVCFAEVGNGRPHIPVGRYQVVTEFSHTHGVTLPDAIGLGWIGASPGCDVVLGRVRGRNGVIPSRTDLGRVLAMIETAEDRGTNVFLEVK